MNLYCKCFCWAVDHLCQMVMWSCNFFGGQHGPLMSFGVIFASDHVNHRKLHSLYFRLIWFNSALNPILYSFLGHGFKMKLYEAVNKMRRILPSKGNNEIFVKKCHFGVISLAFLWHHLNAIFRQYSQFTKWIAQFKTFTFIFIFTKEFY